MAMTPAAAAAVRSLCAWRAASSSTARWRWLGRQRRRVHPRRHVARLLPARRLADVRETRDGAGCAGVALGLRQAAGSQTSLAWAALG
jgi:hypothetical protein